MITTLDIAMLTFMKKLSKEQIEKRKKIKGYLLRSLHVVCYILSVLFIIVCIAVGVQSCNGKNKSQNVTKNKFNDINYALDESQFNQFNYYYQLNYKGDSVSIPLDIQNTLVKYVNRDYDVYNNISGPAGPTQNYVFYVSGLYIYNYETDEFSEINILSVVIQKQYQNSSSTGDVKWRLFSVEVGKYDVFSFFILKNNYETFDHNSYKVFDQNNGYATRFYSSAQLSNNPLLSLIFNVGETSYYNWTTALRVNAPINPAVISINIKNSVFNNHEIYQVSYDLPYFISNGNLYNRILFTYIGGYQNDLMDWENTHNILGYGTGQDLNNGYIDFKRLLNGEGLFTTMSYVNTDNDRSDAVLYRQLLNQTYNDVESEYYLSYYIYTPNLLWSLDSYRSIKFIGFLSDSQKDTLNLINNGTNAYVPVGDNSNAYADVFNLISYSFASLLPFLNIQLIPGLMIGTLLFIPLLLTIIVVIVRLLKK